MGRQFGFAVRGRISKDKQVILCTEFRTQSEGMRRRDTPELPRSLSETTLKFEQRRFPIEFKMAAKMAVTENIGEKDFSWKEFVETCQLLTCKIQKHCRISAITISLVYSIDFHFVVPHFIGDSLRIWCLTCCPRSVTVLIIIRLLIL